MVNENNDRLRVAVIVPCYNEEIAIPKSSRTSRLLCQGQRSMSMTIDQLTAPRMLLESRREGRI